MDLLVVDASVAVKWVVPEEGSLAAVDLRSGYSFAAPDIVFGEFANTMWKKVSRGEVSEEDASSALAAFQKIDIKIVSSRSILVEAHQLSLKLNHPAYDCFYLCAAALLGSRLVTADIRLIRVVSAHPDWAPLIVSLNEAKQSL